MEDLRRQILDVCIPLPLGLIFFIFMKISANLHLILESINFETEFSRNCCWENDLATVFRSFSEKVLCQFPWWNSTFLQNESSFSQNKLKLFFYFEGVRKKTVPLKIHVFNHVCEEKQSGNVFVKKRFFAELTEKRVRDPGARKFLCFEMCERLLLKKSLRVICSILSLI